MKIHQKVALLLSCFFSMTLVTSHDVLSMSHSLDGDTFLSRIVPPSKRNREKDVLCLEIKKQVKHYLKNRIGMQQDAEESNQNYIKTEGLLKIFPHFLEEPSTIKALQMRDLYQLGGWNQETSLWNAIFDVLFNLENNAPPLSGLDQNHPFCHMADHVHAWHEILQQMAKDLKAAPAA